VIREPLIEVLERYANEREQDLARNPLADLIRSHLPEAIRTGASMGTNFPTMTCRTRAGRLAVLMMPSGVSVDVN
jgi:hypothetical protein